MSGMKMEKNIRIILVQQKEENSIIHVLDENLQISKDYPEYMSVPSSQVD
jgi:hypothetical protein